MPPGLPGEETFLRKEKINPEEFEFEERPIAINRVMRVGKGRRTPSFNTLSVVGNRDGIVGIGFGSASEISGALRKSFADARKNLIRVPLSNGTLPHEIICEFKAAKVLLKPARPGTGIIAGHATRAILEHAGVRDALTKCLSSRNVKNIAEATMVGLSNLKNVNDVARIRGKTVEELLHKRTRKSNN
jgi:small subunit ribosomal protein S5